MCCKARYEGLISCPFWGKPIDNLVSGIWGISLGVARTIEKFAYGLDYVNSDAYVPQAVRQNRQLWEIMSTELYTTFPLTNC